MIYANLNTVPGVRVTERVADIDYFVRQSASAVKRRIHYAQPMSARFLSDRFELHTSSFETQRDR